MHPAFKESISNQANYKSESSQPNVEENVVQPNDVVIESVSDVPDVFKANIEKQKQEDLKRINDLKKTTSVAGKRHKVNEHIIQIMFCSNQFAKTRKK